MRVISKHFLLIALGIFALINAFYFFFSTSLIDNAFHISSKSSSTNFFSYYLFSAFAFVEFYTGVFVCMVFGTFLMIHDKFLSSKNILISLVAFGCLFVLGSFFTSYFYPHMIGFGLDSYYKTSLGGSFIFLISSISLMLLAFCLLGKSLFTFKPNINLEKIKNIKIPKIFEKKIQEESNDSFESFDFEDEIYEQEVEEEEADLEELSKDEFFIDQENAKIAVRPNPKVISKVSKIKNPLARKKSISSYQSQDSLITSLESMSRKVIAGPDQKYFESIMNRIEEKLREFKIEAKVINALKGPVVDTFEVELGPGVKVSKVTGLTEDLSLALSGAPIRMIYPLKGRTTMGIEVPRNPREIIYLDEVLKARAYKNSSMKLPIAMGKDAFGATKVVDLGAMPHMLVAGATGAGKSVFINTLLVSLLVKLNPEKLKLILVDPKQLELALYSKLPHLLMPVMTDPKSSSLALLWACQEMERRYTILKEMGVRNIDGFNEKLARSSKADVEKIRKLYKTGESLELPYIVIIVDEFADLILSKVGKDIETNICRLAAKARASGIHLVLATQRPSVDVITGLVKSNFPTRVSFRVTSPVDSRTILNSMGAEKLLGKGDMLYKHGVEMERLHASYIDENEIENFIEKMSSGEPKFNDQAMEFLEEMESGGSDLRFPDEVKIDQTFPEISNKDVLYKDAVTLVQETRSASASFLQRRLKIGYNRAANLIEEMESDGIVGPQQGSKPRKVLI